MRDVVIVDGARTPFGRAIKGSFRQTRVEDLGAAAIVEALKRAKIDGAALGDVAMGCAMPEGSQGLNVARQIAYLAGLPAAVPAYTVNRFCASGLQTIASMAARIAIGEVDAALAGGVESMTAVPMGGYHPLMHPKLVEEHPEIYISMGTTAENVAQRFGISREVQDAFAAASHAKASAARDAGRLAEEIVPFEAHIDGRAFLVEHDETIRAETTVEGLAQLRPVFNPRGSVTAGNASPLTDGGAATVLMAKEALDGRDFLGYFRRFVVVGVEPDIMGIGPLPAIQALLKKTGLGVGDVDLFEVNEAFASQSVYCQKELGIPDDKLNVNGGAIALGHPLGVSGTRLALTALYELRRRGGKRAVVSMCIGGGMGAAALLEAP
ncbi:thiolase family protein [Myxococcota bacterium]|nr:thiolase family protein [Myxococcota bacterium]MBU1431182.1 thiolase family protein [Myxococcota bacterium]MBU1899621.1 thiolase family protein [Myxococcota bacterium]